MMFRRLLPFADCRDTPLRWIAIAVAIFVAVTSPLRVHAQVLTQMEHVSIVTSGEGPPLLLIPGLASPRESWEKQAPELAKAHTLYLVQINGFGAGEDPRANLRPGILDGAVAEIDRFLVAHNAGGVPVVGHSMGGLIALMLAKAHPADVRKLMVVDSFPWIGVLFGANQVAQIEPQGRMIRDQLAASYGKSNPASAQMAAARYALTPEAQRRVAVWSAAADPRVVGEATYEDMTTDLRGDVAGLSAPITLVFPDDDTGAAGKLYAAAYAPAKQLTSVPVLNSRHFVMLDRPDAFAAALSTFLAE